MAKSADDVRDDLRRRGQTLKQWARDHGFPLSAVRAVLSGHNKGYRGQSHRIAVELGMKEAPE